MRTSHYEIYTTIDAADILDQLPLFLERAVAHYTTALGELPLPRQRMTTFVFATRNQWEAKTRQMLPRQSGTFLTLGRGGYTTRGTSVLYFIGPRGLYRDTFAIAAHEGWHQYSQSTFRNHLPVWLEEGIATYMEGFTSRNRRGPGFRPWYNSERYDALRGAARQNELIDLNTLLSTSPQSFLRRGKSRLLVYYAQVWALTHFLAEGEHGRYRPALEQVLHDAASGRLMRRFRRWRSAASDQQQRSNASTRNGPWLIQVYFNPDLDEFEGQYDRFVRQIVQPGRRDRVIGGGSPLRD